MAAFGQSKHAAKASGETAGKIFSFSTMKNYIDSCTRFVSWARENHGCRTLEEAKEHAAEYLTERISGGKSAWTVSRDAAAMGKMYGCSSTSFGAELPKRHRGDVTQHRGGKTAGHFSEERNRDLVDLCKATGLRRHEVAALRPEDVRTTPDGRCLVTVQQGKGGRKRTVDALNSTPAKLAAQAAAEGRERVIEHIPSRTPCHEYRREYAQTVYAAIARPPEQLPESERYYCRGELAGTVYDRAAMQTVSGELGHSRLDVVTAYLT